MTNEEAIKLLSQIMDALLASNSWLPSTDNPIKESFGMAINALTAQPETHEKRTETHACDLISRQETVAALMETFKRNTTTAIRAKLTVEALPSAPQRTGRWIIKPHIYNVAYCSECDFELHINDTPYCPNCGARMEGE